MFSNYKLFILLSFAPPVSDNSLPFKSPLNE